MGGEPRLWAAMPALSLAWKLLWLASDAHPQGKDLYDAVLHAERLLSERTPLSFDLPLYVFNTYESWDKQEFALAALTGFYIEWQHFHKAFPWIHIEVGDWEKRLHTALEPTFTLGSWRADQERGRPSASFMPPHKMMIPSMKPQNPAM